MAVFGLLLALLGCVLIYLYDRSKRFEEFLFMYLDVLAQNGFILDHKDSKAVFLDIALSDGKLMFRSKMFAFLSYFFLFAGFYLAFSLYGNISILVLFLPLVVLAIANFLQNTEKQVVLDFIGAHLLDVQDRMKISDLESVNLFLVKLIEKIKAMD